MTEGKDPDLFRALAFGYVKSLTDKQAIEVLKEYALNKPFSRIIFHRVKEINDSKLLDDLAKYFLSCYMAVTKYPEKQRFSYYLNGISKGCTKLIQIEIFTCFLNSDKRSFRKYAYKNKDLNIIGLFELAWELVSNNPAEATYLIRTIAYCYSDEFILKYFEKIVMHPNIEEYQIRKLFKQHPSLTKENWLWLKENYPDSFLYIAAIKNYPINDNQCFKICQELINSTINENLLLWCLAKMHKWEIIEKIVKSS